MMREKEKDGSVERRRGREGYNCVGGDSIALGLRVVRLIAIVVYR